MSKWTPLIKSYFACGWSAFTYIFNGMPDDKQSYWSEEQAPEYQSALAVYKSDPSFHNLKDIGVEWTRAWPQRSFKVAAMFGMLLGVLGCISGLALLLPFLFF